MDKDMTVKITNRDNGPVGYYIPDLNQYRRFTAGETKDIPVDEVKKLYAVPGGAVLLRDFLLVQDVDLYKEIVNVEPEPEYFYTNEDIEKLLQSGTDEQLMDFLDFAPEGGIDVMKKLAVELPLNSVSKMNIIREKIGYNVANAIRVKKESESEEEVKKEKVGRRAAPISKKEEETTSETGRKATPIRKYNVVNKDK